MAGRSRPGALRGLRSPARKMRGSYGLGEEVLPLLLPPPGSLSNPALIMPRKAGKEAAEARAWLASWLAGGV